MSWSAIILVSVSWIAILGTTIFCLYKILSTHDE